jgi:hypothetical protein
MQQVLNHRATRSCFSHNLALSDSYPSSASEQAKGDTGDVFQPSSQVMKVLEGKEEHALDDAPNSSLEASRAFAVGTVLEAEMMDPRFPNYTDTIHPVEVVAIQEDGVFLCRMLAFEPEDTDTWTADLLHLPVKPEEIQLTWNQGDRVHFRFRNRKSRNKM